MFEEKIKKPMELYLQASSNVISMNSLNTIIANDIEKSKLGEASFYKNEINMLKLLKSLFLISMLIFVEHLDLVKRIKLEKNIISITVMKKLERVEL